MEEKYFVPFETAKQLKEKGYDEENDYVYADFGAGIGLNYADFELYVFKNRNSDITAEDSEKCTAPTYHEVIDWLEGKGITIVLDCWFDCKKWSCMVRMDGNIVDIPYQDTREEALNVAILKALEML